MKLPTRILAALILQGLSGAAFAHPGHDVSGFSAGWLHPFAGADHLLAMLAVGLWAAQRQAGHFLQLPATFMTSLLLGAWLSSLLVPMAIVETGIAVSVLALGLLIALSLQLPVVISVALTALFGLMHGYAHGLELPQSVSPASYASGFLLSTALLHLGGIALGLYSRRQFALLARVLGATIAFSGAWMLAAA